MDHRAVRHDGADEYFGGTGRERCGGDPAEGSTDGGSETRAGTVDGWEWAMVPVESARGRDARGGGSGAECGDERCATDCGDELFELWESGEIGSNVGI